MNHPIRSRADLATWVDSCVLGDLRTLLVGVDAYYASPDHVAQDVRPLGAANFLLVAGCCSAIDYFGFLLNRGSSDSWPKRIVLEGDASLVVTGAGSEGADPHLAASPDVAGDSFLMNGRQLLLDLTRAFEGTFRDWILTQSSDDVLDRANPPDLLVRAGDMDGRRQLETVKRWSRGYKRADLERPESHPPRMCDRG